MDNVNMASQAEQAKVAQLLRSSSGTVAAADRTVPLLLRSPRGGTFLRCGLPG
jgi:hypothetical protein